MLQTLLIVDDDSHLRAALTELLTREGYRVLTAAHGREALKIMEVVTPALVLTDLSMPVLNGWELVRAIRGNPDLARLPVVVFSGAATRRPPRAVPMILKSAGPEQLLRFIRSALAAHLPRANVPQTCGGALEAEPEQIATADGRGVTADERPSLLAIRLRSGLLQAQPSMIEEDA